jgi:hypothetical protein
MLFTVSIVVLLAAIVAGLVLQHRLYSRLVTSHPKVLEILAESSAGIMAFQRYFWKRRYVGLSDGALTRQADLLRRYWTGCFILFMLIVAALVVPVIF